jgi:hypothetical protein
VVSPLPIATTTSASSTRRSRVNVGLPTKSSFLYLLIERVLAGEMTVSGEVPDDVVGQAAEDLPVIAAAETLEIRLDDLFAW